MRRYDRTRPNWNTLSYSLSRVWWFTALVITIVVGLILGGCAAQEPTPVPTAAPTPGPTLLAPAEPPAQITYIQVEVQDADLKLEVPASWQQLVPDWAWSPSEDGLPRVGVAWRSLRPPEEPEAVLLPSPSQVLASEPIDLGWASGRRVMLEVYGSGTGAGETQAPVASVETHVLLVVQEGTSRRAYDLYAAAGSVSDLEAVEPILQHLLDAANLDHESAAATPAEELAVVPSAEALEAALAARLVNDPEGLCEWAVWGQAGQELYLWAVCEAGSGTAASVPAVVHLSADGQVNSVRLPRDGAYYGPDIRELFPVDVRERILTDDFDAAAAMGRIAERRAAGQSTGPGEMLAVTIYFGNSELNPDIQDCRLVYPVVRLVTVETMTATDPDLALAEAALRELFAGPSAAEAEQGYVSMFSAQTASILKNIKVEGKTAYVNLMDIRQVIPSAGTSCGSQALLAEVGSTVRAALPVERVLYAIEGDPAAFYDWMQFGCSAENDFCDPAPFVEDEG
jgi:hypothetical protein